MRLNFLLKEIESLNFGKGQIKKKVNELLVRISGLEKLFAWTKAVPALSAIICRSHVSKPKHTHTLTETRHLFGWHI